MGFKVELRPSGHTFEVPKDKTILLAGLEAGYNLPYSCRAGVCNTCRGVIKSGRVDYGDVHPTYLSGDDKSKGYVLCCQARPVEDVVIQLRELDGLESIRPRIVPSRIEKIEKPAPDVAVIRLRLPMNENFRFLAGQHIDLLLKDSKRRSYSIATQPRADGTTTLELHVRHSPGGLFTDQVFYTLKERDLIRLEGPLGTFYVREHSDKPIVMVASGTGFSPLKSMCEAALQKDMKRPITFYWGGWRKRDLYMLDLAQSWQHPNLKFIPVLSDPTPECAWAGRTGFVHRAAIEDFPDLSGYQVYACGSPSMVHAARRDFSERCGLPEDEFFADAFLTEADKAVAA